MHYIRFLKVPSTKTSKGKLRNTRVATISSLITLSTDLQESFLASAITLRVTLRASTPSRPILATKIFEWAPWMRSLPISLTYTIPPAHENPPTDGILSVSATENRADDVRQLYASKDEIRILSAFSTSFGILKNDEKAEMFVERKLQVSASCMISIWEETGESIARHIWPGGLAITSYLSTLPTPPCGALPLLDQLLTSTPQTTPLNILELGSGVGLAGIATSSLLPSSTVTLTDLPLTTEITEKNLLSLPFYTPISPTVTNTNIDPPSSSYSASNKQRIQYSPLNWDSPLPSWSTTQSYDIILVADCTYNTVSIPSLVKTLTSLTTISQNAIILLAHKKRHDSEEMFFELGEKEGLIRRDHVVFEMAGDVVDLYTLTRSSCA